MIPRTAIAISVTLSALSLMIFARTAEPAVFVPIDGEMHLSATGQTIEGTTFSAATDLTLSSVSLRRSTSGQVSPLDGIGAELNVAVHPTLFETPSGLERIDISGDAYVFSGPGRANYASGTGRIGFDVSLPVQVSYSFVRPLVADTYLYKGNAYLSLYSTSTR